MQQTDTQSTGTLADRGIGWQATGFTVTGLASLTILKIFDGSDYWLYQWFETAAVDLYWAFVLPLAVLFDGGRKLFEKGKAIRDAQKARMVEKAQKKARADEQKRIQQALEKHGVDLSPEIVEAVFGNKSENPE